jgi:hypothetical protein
VLRRLAELCHLEVVVSRKRLSSKLAASRKLAVSQKGAVAQNGYGSKSAVAAVAVAGFVADLWLPPAKLCKVGPVAAKSL